MSMDPETPIRQLALEQEVNLLELASVPLKRWRMVVGFPILLGALTVVVALLMPPTYTAVTSFVPEPGSEAKLVSVGGIASLAGQFGVSFGAAASQSPRFYAEVVKSREILERVLLTRYLDPRGHNALGDSATLLRILGVGGDNFADSLHNGTKNLQKRLAVRVDNQTNIVRLSVDARQPQLAAAIAARFVEYLNDFNAQKRQSQARERRRFVEQRLANAEQELRQAEEELKLFYQRNRSWQQSPELVFEEGRLRRRVDIRQEVSLTLKREYETARIEEVNDTPVITVIDPPVAPQDKSKPKPLLVVVIALFLGTLVSLLWAFGTEYFDRMRREEAGDYREFSRLLDGVRSDITHPWRLITRRDRP